MKKSNPFFAHQKQFSCYSFQTQLYDIFKASVCFYLAKMKSCFTISVQPASVAKVHSFLKRCLHDLHFMKTRSFHQTFPSQPQLTSAERPCFHKMKNTVSKMNRFQCLSYIFTFIIVYYHYHFFRIDNIRTSVSRIVKFLHIGVKNFTVANFF